MNSEITLIFVVIAALSLLLFSVRKLSESTQHLGAGILNHAFSWVHSPLMSMFSGMVSAMVVQSRTSTSMTAGSYATSGIFSLKQLMGFLLGVHLGSVFIPMFFVFDWGIVSLVLISAGALPMLLSDSDIVKPVGKLCFALGMLLLCQWLVAAALPVSIVGFKFYSFDSPFYQYFPVLGLAVAAAVLVKSSATLISLVVLLTTARLIDGDLALGLVLVVNLASLVPVLISNWNASYRARYANLFNFLVFFLVVVLFILFFAPISQLIFQWSEALVNGVHLRWINFYEGVGVVMLHFLLNLAVVLIGLLLLDPINKLVIDRLPHAKDKQPQKLTIIGSSHQASSVMAVNLLTEEVKKMSAMVQSMLLLTNDALKDLNRIEAVDRVSKYEGITDNICEEIQEFISKLVAIGLSAVQGEKLRHLGLIVNELENIADQCRSIVQAVRDHKSDSISDGHATSQMERYFESVLTYYESFFVAFAEHGVKVGRTPVGEEAASQFLVMRKEFEALRGATRGETDQQKEFVLLADLSVALGQIQSHTKSMHASIFPSVES